MENTPSPRGRGRPPTINRADVVDAALRLARQVGLDRFTMAQLADELGVAQMTAYHHVANRTELTQLVVEKLLDQVDVPGPERGTWDVRLKQLEASARRELGGIPGVRSRIDAAGSPATRRLVDGVLGILADAGFDGTTALLAYGALFTYMIGQLDFDSVAMQTTAAPDTLRFAELTARSVAGHHPTPDEFFDFGFDLLLAGLRAMLPRTN